MSAGFQDELPELPWWFWFVAILALASVSAHAMVTATNVWEKGAFAVLLVATLTLEAFLTAFVVRALRATRRR